MILLQKADHLIASVWAEEESPDTIAQYSG